MSREPPLLSLLVLTEDSAADAHDVMVALVKKMLWLLDPHYRSHLVAFRPADDAQRKVMQGNRWKSRNPRDRARIVLLGRAIAALLLQEEVPGFVLFHIDGDVPWSRRAESDNVQQFDGFLRDYVLPALGNALRAQQHERGDPPREEQLATSTDAALKRLFLVVPFYSIEAWLYQNTTEARRLCAEAESCGMHLDVIGRWEVSRGELDELDKPKGQLCLGASHNLVLAEQGFPAQRAFDAGKSFTAAVVRLLECDDLTAALARTRTPIHPA